VLRSPKVPLNLASDTHQSSVNWYKVWRYSCISVLTSPYRRNEVQRAAKVRGLVPARE
jgi:hypothetical protein